jgi:WD40 repeat protein
MGEVFVGAVLHEVRQWHAADIEAAGHDFQTFADQSIEAPHYQSDGGLLFALPEGMTITCLAVTCDNSRIAAGTMTGQVMIYSLGNSSLSQIGTPSDVHAQRVQFVDSLNRLLVHRGDEVEIYDADSGTLLSRIQTAVGKHVYFVASDPTGSVIAVSYRGDPNSHIISVYSVDNGIYERDLEVFSGRTKFCFNPSGDRIAGYSISDTNRVWVMDMRTALVVLSFEEAERICHLLFSPNECHLVTACVGGQILVRDAISGEIYRNIKVALPRSISMNTDGLKLVISTTYSDDIYSPESFRAAIKIVDLTNGEEYMCAVGAANIVDHITYFRNAVILI